MSDFLQPHELQHSRLLCPSVSPRVCLNSCSLSQWCHPTISSSLILFSFCLQSFLASGSFPMSQLFTAAGQSIGASASVQFSSVAQSGPTLCNPRTAAHQASLSITNSWSLPKLMSIESVMHPTISSSVIPFSSCLQSFPASGSFPKSQFYASGGQSIGVASSASVFPMNTQD